MSLKREEAIISPQFYFTQTDQSWMLPSMRYHCAKLSELVHEQKTYRLHMSSVDKIMNKSSNEFVRRSQQLRQLKSRKEQSFNYEQYKRGKQIGHLNQILFSKILSSSKIDKNLMPAPSDSLQMLEQKIQERNMEQQGDKVSPDRPFVLRNHRQSPIHKSTLLERTRQNFRLAKKIVNPIVTYRTQNYLKQYREKSHHKERIMKYGPELARTKAEMYVERRLSNSMLNSKRDGSSLGSSLSSKFYFEKNPELTPRVPPK